MTDSKLSVDDCATKALAVMKDDELKEWVNDAVKMYKDGCMTIGQAKSSIIHWLHVDHTRQITVMVKDWPTVATMDELVADYD
jgi:hypothetical protein